MCDFKLCAKQYVFIYTRHSVQLPPPKLLQIWIIISILNGSWESQDLHNWPKIAHPVRVWEEMQERFDSITSLFLLSRSCLQKISKPKCPILGAWVRITAFVGHKRTVLLAGERNNEHGVSLVRAYPVDYGDRSCAPMGCW